MTTGAQLDFASSVTNTPAWVHLMSLEECNPVIEAVGELSILEAVFVNEEAPIMLDVLSDDAEIREQPDNEEVIMEEDDIIIEIVEAEGDIVDVIC